MKTRMKPLLVSASGAIAVALLALSFTVGGARTVRAEDDEALAAARPDMVLVSAKALEGLEQRVSYLEEIVASLTESSQRVSTRQLCVSDDSGAETCVTKAQLDALLTSQAHTAEADQPAPISGVEGTPSVKEQTAAAPTSNSEPPVAAVPASNPVPSAPAGSNGSSLTEPESTGSISASTAPPAAPTALLSAPPDSEAVKPDELPGSISTATAAPAAPAAQPSAPPDSEAVKPDELP
jgi:hypothetical protein